MKTIRNIAVKIRKQCEVFAFSRDAEDYDFYRCHDLSCMCAVASYTLVMALRNKGIKSDMIMGKYGNKHDHCWVEAKDHIIDITGSQFNLPNVVVYPLIHKDYQKTRIIKNCSNMDWDGQNPSPEISKRILNNS